MDVIRNITNRQTKFEGSKWKNRTRLIQVVWSYKKDLAAGSPNQESYMKQEVVIILYDVLINIS